MKRYFKSGLIFLMFSILTVSRVRGADNLGEGLAKGLLEEEAHQDLNAAIEAYQAVLKQFEEQRNTAATAAFRLGECYRKQGKLAEAAVQFERVVREFSDHATLAQLSRKYLASAGQAAMAAGSVPAGPDSPSRVNPEEVKLLKEEIALVEQLLADVEKRRQSGRASSADVIQIKRQLIPLRRKLPDHAEPAKQQALINEEIALVQELLGQGQKQIEVGRANAADQIPLRRDLLRLQRELLAVKDRPSFQTRLNTIVRRADSPDAPSEEEAKEIQRLQRIIENSPDLINGRTGGQTPLHQAAAKGQLAVARFLLDNKADVNATTQPPSRAAQTALHLAADAGHKAMVELLLKGGADVNARDGEGKTALFNAAARGYLAVAQVLLANGADVNAVSPAGETPLHTAVFGTGSKAMIELLLAHKAKVNAQTDQGSTPLIYAVMSQRLDIVKLLLDHNADVHLKSNEGSTALTVSVQASHSQIMQMLLSRGADPNVIAIKPRNVHGYANATVAPLHLAASNDDLPIITSLLKHGAKVNLQDDVGRTPLHWAVLTTNNATFQELLNAGADPDIADVQGNTVVLAALIAEQTSFLPALLQKGADVNTPAHNKNSPLLWAIKNDRKNTAELLLSKGADPNQKGPSGYSPLHVAAGARGNSELAQLLINHKAQVNARDDAGNSPLHYAAMRGVKETVKLLLDSGADPGARNAAGETPLEMLTGTASKGGFGLGAMTKNYSWNDWGLPVEIGGPAMPQRVHSPAQMEAAALLERAAARLQETRDPVEPR